MVPVGVIQDGCIILMIGAAGSGLTLTSMLLEVGQPNPVTLFRLYRIMPVVVGVALTLLPVLAESPAAVLFAPHV